jgi:predicted GIY-YIG superfamily endonuclease
VSFTVYLLIGDDGNPIYIGASTNIEARLRTHHNDKAVYGALNGRTKREAIQRVERVECRDRDEMHATELRLIKEHRPVLNRAGNNETPIPQRPGGMSDDERTRLRAAGRAKALALPSISPECARRVAELLREPINRFVADSRRALLDDGRDRLRDRLGCAK